MHDPPVFGYTARNTSLILGITNPSVPCPAPFERHDLATWVSIRYQCCGPLVPPIPFQFGVGLFLAQDYVGASYHSHLCRGRHFASCM